jgi:hypothetical protein
MFKALTKALLQNLRRVHYLTLTFRHSVPAVSVSTALLKKVCREDGGTTLIRKLDNYLQSTLRKTEENRIPKYGNDKNER